MARLAEVSEVKLLPALRPLLPAVLTDREARFVGVFTGTAHGVGSRAAEMAGYRHGRVAAVRLMKQLRVRAAIEQRQAAIEAATAVRAAERQAEREAQWREQIASAVERRAILKRWARDERHLVSAIRAIDTLNRMDGVYVEKHEHAVLVPEAGDPRACGRRGFAPRFAPIRRTCVRSLKLDSSISSASRLETPHDAI